MLHLEELCLVAYNRLTVTTLSRSPGSGCPPIQPSKREEEKVSNNLDTAAALSNHLWRKVGWREREMGGGRVLASRGGRI